MLKISVSIIVKNEESCLAKCLDSVKGVDEIVIVDTGSTDNTIEIAKKYTDKIYTDYKWNDNFSEARNHALSKCTGDWVIHIDADEVLETPIEEIKKIISEVGNARTINCTLNYSGLSHRFPKIIKRCPDVYWVGAIHNHLNVLGEYDSQISYQCYHSKAHSNDPDRALRILTKVVKENPKCVREKYYLAREYWYRKDYKTALKKYEEYLKVATWLPEKADAYLMSARCLWNLRRGEEARQFCLKAININVNFKEALLLMAEMSWEHNAKTWRKFAELATNENVLFIRTPIEKNNKYYDELFKRDTDMSRYKEIQEEIGKMIGNKSVLDIGCGTGELAKYVEKYSGFDFSEEAVKLAGDKCWLGNAYDKENFKKADVMVATEVFEHLDDLKVIANIPQGQEVIFSVPSFTNPSHIRIFTEESMKERYKDYFDIKSVTRFNWYGKWTKGKNTPSYILLVEAKKK